MIIKYKGITVETAKGDITEVDAEAIVTTTNTRLVMDSQVSMAIKEKAGEDIEKKAMAKGPIAIGQVVFTDGGKLKAKYIIHAADIEFNDKVMTDIIKIREATKNSLICAEELAVKSVAFPAMGTGIADFPIEYCTRTMVKAIKNYIDKMRTDIEKIILVAYNDSFYDNFAKELRATIINY